jgi:flagellar biosynthesis anti-sigma factor FlgM
MNEINPTGKIGRRSAIKNTNAKITQTKGDTAIPTGGQDKVTLSTTSKVKGVKKAGISVATDVRRDLVAKFKSHLRDGTYVVKAEEIADKIVQKIRENKNKMIF